MSINFFDDAHKSSTSKKLFGLCDDIDNPSLQKNLHI